MFMLLCYLHLSYPTAKGPHTEDGMAQSFISLVTPPPKLPIADLMWLLSDLYQVCNVAHSSRNLLII